MTNQLLAPSPLPFELPDFDGLTDDDFLPALKAGIVEQQQQIQRILGQDSPADFVNTIEELEASGQVLRRTLQVFFPLYSADGTPARQEIVGEISALWSAHQTEMMLNRALYQRCERAMSNSSQALTDEQQRTGQKWLDGFIAAGAHLDSSAQEQLRLINTELSELSTEFTRIQLEGQNAAAVLVKNRDELDGLSDSEINSLANAAQEAGLDGYLIGLELPLVQSITQKLTQRSLRQRVFEASASRGTAENHPTAQLIKRIIYLRARKAELLGFSDFASSVLPQRTAPSVAAVEELVAQVVPEAMAQAINEYEQLAEFAAQNDGVTDFGPWDHPFYASRVKENDYSVDQSEIRKYFEFEKVLTDGVFYAAHQLFGITMIPREDLKAYAPDVRVWEVVDQDKTSIGLFIGDYFTRATKQGGAWMTSLRDAADLLQELPVVTNVMNIVPSGDDGPTLLSLDEITTMFHEFGHALHGLLSTVEYPSISGTAVPTDFVEFPSQFNEMWAMWPTVVENYAHHVETQEILSEELREKIIRSEKFGQGYATVEYLAAAIIDWAWHRLSPQQAAEIDDIFAFEEQVLNDAGINSSIVPPRYRSTFFKHVFSGDHYAAGYYSYFWAEVLDADAEAWMKDNGGLTRQTGSQYRNEILACGDMREPMNSYQSFTGREPDPAHLLRRRGLLKESI